MKKILSLLLCAALIFQTLLINVSAQEQSYEISDKILAVFKYLDIIELNDSGEVDTSAGISRAEFADWVARLLHAEPVDKTKMYFQDVPYSHWAYNSINALYEFNYISSAEDGKFRPDDNITYGEASKILLTAAGYGDYAMLRGGFPQGYIDTISFLNLTPVSGMNNELKKGMALELMYNVFSIGIYRAGQQKGGSIAFYVSDDTLFSVYCGLKENKGVVNAVFGKTMDKSYAAEANTAIIDGEKYTLGKGVNLDSLFCGEAEIVYEEPEDEYSSEGKIIYAGSSKKGINEDVITVDSKSIKDFDTSSYKLTYYKDGQQSKLRTVSIGKNALVIYNGYPTLKSLESLVSDFIANSRRGSITVRKDNEDYDIVVLDSYTSFVLGNKDVDKNKMYNKLNSDDIINLTDYQYAKIVNSNNELIELKDIDINTPLSIAASEYNDMITVKASDFIVTGVLKSKSDSSGEISFMLDNGDSYDVESIWFEKYGGGVSVGQSYSFYIDCFGRIAYVETENRKGKNAGYMLAVFLDSSIETMELKVFTDAGEMKVFNFADRVQIDGVSYKGDKGLLMAIDSIPGTTGIYDLSNPWNSANKPQIKPQVVLYELNDEGKIKMLDTSYVSSKEDAENTLTQIPSSHPKKLCQYINGTDGLYRFDLNLIYSKKNTLTILVPYLDENGYLLSDTDRNRVISSSSVGGGGIAPQNSDYSINNFTLWSGRAYMVEGYSYNNENEYCDILLVTNPIYTQYEYPIIVSNITTALDREDTVVKRVEGFVNGVAMNFDVENESYLSDVKAGDIIKGNYNAATGKLVDVLKIYDVDDNIFLNKGTNPSTPEWWYDGYDTPNYLSFTPLIQLTLGYVTEKNGSTVKWSYESPSYDEHKRLNYDECYYLEGLSCTVYDSEADEVHEGTIDDVREYRSAGADCSRIMRFSNYETTRAVYIIN